MLGGDKLYRIKSDVSIKVQLSLCLIKHHGVKLHGGEEAGSAYFQSCYYTEFSDKFHVLLALQKGENIRYAFEKDLGGLMSV